MHLDAWLQLVLFGGVRAVWPCWRKYATGEWLWWGDQGGGFESLKTQVCSLCFLFEVLRCECTFSYCSSHYTCLLPPFLTRTVIDRSSGTVHRK